MTDLGQHILVEVGEVGLDELLRKVHDEGRVVRLCQDGQPVADLTPIKSGRRFIPDPRLAVKFNVDSMRLTTDEDWPEQR